MGYSSATTRGATGGLHIWQLVARSLRLRSATADASRRSKRVLNTYDLQRACFGLVRRAPVPPRCLSGAEGSLVHGIQFRDHAWRHGRLAHLAIGTKVASAPLSDRRRIAPQQTCLKHVRSPSRMFWSRSPRASAAALPERSRLTIAQCPLHRHPELESAITV